MKFVLRACPWTVLAAACATAFGLAGCGRPPTLREWVEVRFAAKRWVYPEVSMKQAAQACTPEVGRVGRPESACTEVGGARPTMAVPSVDRGIGEGERRHLQGLALLASQRSEGQVGRALRELRRAVELLPEDAGVWNDLGVAEYLAASRDSRRLTAALGAFERALVSAPGNQAAQFNRALVLHTLGLAQDAQEAWDRYLESSEPGSLRAREAAELRTALDLPVWNGERPPVDDPRSLRAWLLNQLLTKWPAAVLTGDEATADAVVATMVEASRTLTDLGDTATAELIAQVRTADEVDRKILAELHAGFESARRAIEASRSAVALEALEKLLPGLLERGSPLALEAEYLRATAEFALARYDAAAAVLDSLIARLDGQHMPAGPATRFAVMVPGDHVANTPLIARARALRGLIHYFSGGPAAALPLLRSALEGYPAYGSNGDLAYFSALAMECFNLLDDSHAAWRKFLAAATRVPRVPGLRRRVQVLNMLADFTLRQGEVALSFRYQDEAVRWAKRLDDASFLADVVLWRAVVRSRLGDAEGADADLARAEQVALTIEDPTRRRLAAADQQLIRGLSAVERDPVAARDHLTGAIDAYEREVNRSALLLASEARAATARRLGDAVTEGEDLERSWYLWQQLGEGPLDEPYRVTLGDRWESVFDQRVRFEAERGRYESAFATYVRGREITQPMPGRRPTDPPAAELDGDTPLTEIQGVLNEDTVLVAYCVLAGQTLIFELRHDHFALHRRPVTAREVAALVDTLTRRRSDATERESSSATLYVELVAPWLRPGRDTTLILVPDKELFRLPFVLLRGGDGSPRLMEEARIAIAPSPRWAIVGPLLDRRRRSFGEESRALFVADPEFELDAFPDLMRLPAARANAEGLSDLFPGAAVLVGAAATPPAVEAQLQAATWIDFSSHAVAGSATPLDSFLVLAPATAGTPGTLTARQLLELPMARARLVSLSACRSGATLPGQWQGALQLARPFLLSGVPAVVATLWDVDDAAGARFTLDLYRELATGADSLSAFHRTQTRAAHATPPAEKLPDWAAFQLFGVPEPGKEDPS